MVAQAEPSLTSLARACSRAKTLTAACAGAALLTVTVGILGLNPGSVLRQMLESWINIHVLFGMLLCGLVVARCLWQVRHSPQMLQTDIRALSRHLSRIVYLVLYLVIGVRQTLGVLRHGPDYAGFNPQDDFQIFLASGLCVLFLIRILAFRLWLRSDPAAARHFG
jgi:hypothetical protein